ncbi:cysteine desulfurase [Wenjunlia vitaminophila]|uniref:Cysteine desulfurase n=1 Tax=Wenjunlia vitaminophila TaxID=76728 RepID=A0A0T6LKJ8_WENVI|nr:cysteine desulfurase [Wenjunlia vitaminophila]KRV46631.1 cysteine desulfurase [Wenjunlia vitaminophila]
MATGHGSSGTTGRQGGGEAGYDIGAVRKDFPALSRTVRDGRPLVYLDSAATAHKPWAVLDAERDFYAFHNSNVHRGVHALAEEATELYEQARARVAGFVGAVDTAEIVFTKNASEALNLVAYALGNANQLGCGDRFRIGPGDEVVITEMEHHSNLIPWQVLCQRTGATLRWLTITPEGRLDLDDLDRVITERTRVVAFTHQSNIYGTVNPVELLTARARRVGALTVLDACQSVPHMPVDVERLGVDFMAFSGHKMCGPTGIGVLWGRYDLLAALPPFLTGGEMNEVVTMASSTYAQPPYRFEAGTPVIAQAIGLGAAVGYLETLGMEAVADHGRDLTAYALEALAEVDHLRVLGPTSPRDRGGAISFALGDADTEDIGRGLDALGIAVRVGHLCARPACVRFKLPATTRASFHLYTTRDEIDAFVHGLREVSHALGVGA